MALFGITTKKPPESPLAAFARTRKLTPKLVKPDTRAERLYGAKGKQS
jgi:hypothetical protein